MTIGRLLKIFILPSFGILVFTSCKKVSVPNNDSRLIIGQWKYINGSCWPTDKSIWIEFKDNGRFKKHERGKIVRSEKFSFKQVNWTNGTQSYIIDLDKGRDQTFKVSGDTLFLSDYGWTDGCSSLFIKK